MLCPYPYLSPGFQPRTRHRLEAYATLLSGVSSAHRYHATVLV
jgi:hypothetical protein